MLNWLRRFLERIGLTRRTPSNVAVDVDVKYVNVRRYLAYLEDSIEEKTQWAVFEANDFRLWSSVRREIETFLYNEWTSRALIGDKPENAFFVRCDRSTMTQSDIDNGRLVAVVGVAPLRPAEFVIFRIGQWTRDKKDSDNVPNKGDNAALQPLNQFNFLVELGKEEPSRIVAGFQECSALTEPERNVLTLKRGVISGGSLETLLGSRDLNVPPQTIIIRSQNEDHSLGLTWRLRKARVVKIVSGPLNSKGTDVAIEELVLAYERLDDDDD